MCIKFIINNSKGLSLDLVVDFIEIFELKHNSMVRQGNPNQVSPNIYSVF